MTTKPTNPLFFIDRTAKSSRTKSTNGNEFDRESSVHRLYESAQKQVEAEQTDRLTELKKQIQDGTYEPNLSVVAERMLPDLGLHLN